MWCFYSFVVFVEAMTVIVIDYTGQQKKLYFITSIGISEFKSIFYAELKHVLSFSLITLDCQVADPYVLIRM
jgi:hypothetical protein